MPAMKRPAAAATVPAKSKKPKVDPVKQKCDQIQLAIECAEHIPSSAREMLAIGVPESLGVLKDQRVSCQEQFVEMIGESLGEIEASIQKNIVDLDAKVTGADAEKAERDAALTAAQTALEAKVTTVDEKKAVLAEDDQALTQATSALEEALAAQLSGDSDLEAAGAKIEQLNTATTELYTPLKEGTVDKPKEAKKLAASLIATLKKLEFDGSMLGAVSVVLNKEAKDRGQFDTLVLTQLEAAVSDRIASLNQLVAEGEPAKAARAAAVQTAEAAKEAASAKKAASVAAHKDAQGERKEGEQAVKAAKKSVNDFLPEMEEVKSEREAAAARLAEFQEGPLAAYAELKERSTPPLEPEEAPEPELVEAAEPAADAEVASKSPVKASPAKSPAKVMESPAKVSEAVEAVAGA